MEKFREARENEVNKAAEWLASEARTGFSYRVDALIPSPFRAYARIFHPARYSTGEQESEVRWLDVAKKNGRTFHPSAEWGSLTGSWSLDFQEGLWNSAPDVGTLPSSVARGMVSVLTSHTETPEQCWFAAWEGFGCVRNFFANAPRLEVARRTMLLLKAPISAVTGSICPPPQEQSPNLWWPNDRSWCVATDIDLMTTYVGGDYELINDLLAAPSLEVMAVSGAQEFVWTADTINPLPSKPGA
jgi:hypothetical protein